MKEFRRVLLVTGLVLMSLLALSCASVTPATYQVSQSIANPVSIAFENNNYSLQFMQVNGQTMPSTNEAGKVVFYNTVVVNPTAETTYQVNFQNYHWVPESMVFGNFAGSMFGGSSYYNVGGQISGSIPALDSLGMPLSPSAYRWTFTMGDNKDRQVLVLYLNAYEPLPEGVGYYRIPGKTVEIGTYDVSRYGS
jgi:hypothetical protein